MPTVSIVIPAYNAMAFLPETLDTVWAQTFADFEVLIVNDGSTDDLSDWVAQQTDTRLRLISQPNLGLAAARNTGIQASQGTYIALLDGDDLWEPRKLEQQVARLERHPKVGLVYTWTVLVDSKGQPTGRYLKSEVEGQVWRQFLTYNWIGCGSNPLIRRICFERVGDFDTQLRASEDWDMWIRLAKHYPFAVIRSPLVRYRQSPCSMSKDCDRMWTATRAVIEKQFKAAPAELQYLRNHSYSNQALYIGWKALDGGNGQQALHFLRLASAHRPPTTHAWAWLRLALAIVLFQGIGNTRFGTLRKWRYALRCWASGYLKGHP